MNLKRRLSLTAQAAFLRDRPSRVVIHPENLSILGSIGADVVWSLSLSQSLAGNRVFPCQRATAPL